MRLVAWSRLDAQLLTLTDNPFDFDLISQRRQRRASVRVEPVL